MSKLDMIIEKHQKKRIEFESFEKKIENELIQFRELQKTFFRQLKQMDDKSSHEFTTNLDAICNKISESGIVYLEKKSELEKISMCLAGVIQLLILDLKHQRSKNQMVGRAMEILLAPITIDKVFVETAGKDDGWEAIVLPLCNYTVKFFSDGKMPNTKGEPASFERSH
ncbi:hypothetical protein HK096_010110 [Nowakowskiella sp. JEL0078]|nr:hypothetical protein HK096_010110 [Nowakowskiella sp. JEL0078]